jgi:hypothetical protein
VDLDDPVGLGDRQRPQHDGVHGAEDGGGGADAEREREDSDQREARRRDHLAEGERGVLPQLGEVLKESHPLFPLMANRPALVPRAFQVAEPVEGRAPRLALAHPARHQLAAAHREMELELRVDFFVDARAPSRRGKRVRKSTDR